MPDLDEIIGLLDDVIEPKKPIDKSLSFNPARLQTMSEEGPYYNPYRVMEDGSFMPHPREYWTSVGKEPEGYQNVFELYRDAGHYRKSLKSKIISLLKKAEDTDKQIDKVSRDAFIYLEPQTRKARTKLTKNFAQCSTCPMWTGKESLTCTIHGGAVEVKGSMSCGYYTPGSPMPEAAGEEHLLVTPEESGLIEADVRCENCAYMDHTNKVCKLYSQMNKAMPTVFNLDENVEEKACCNAWVGIKNKEDIVKSFDELIKARSHKYIRKYTKGGKDYYVYPDDVNPKKEHHRLSTEEQAAGLRQIGNWLLGIDDTTELNKEGFNKFDYQRWQQISMMGGDDVPTMRNILKKYKRQIIGSGDWSEEDYHALGLSDPTVAVVKPAVNKYGGVEFPLKMDGKIPREDFGKYVQIHKDMGFRGGTGIDGKFAWQLDRDKAATFDFGEYERRLNEIGFQLGPVPLIKPKTEVKPGMEFEGLSVSEIIEGIKDRRIKNVAAVQKMDDGAFAFYFPYSEKLNQVFSNRGGMLTGIMEYRKDLGHARVTYDISLAEEALERVKEVVPEWKVFTEGVKEARDKKDRDDAELRKPIPEVQAVMAEGLSLFPYQNEGVRFFQKTNGNALLGDEMGLGKTPMTLAWAASSNKRVLAVVPKVVRRTWVQEAEKFFPGYYKGKTKELIPKELKKDGMPDLSDVNLATVNYESFEKFRPAIEAAGFDTIVIDECFHPNTMVRTKTGEKPISQIRSGDLVRNCMGWDTVLGVGSKKLDKRIALNYNGREIICSTNHPFFTSDGWVLASDLKIGDCLANTEAFVPILQSTLREGYLSEYGAHVSDLLGFLCNEIKGEISKAPEIYARTQSDVQQSIQGSDERDAKENRSSTSRETREWDRSDNAREFIIERTGERLDLEPCNKNQDGQGQWFSYQLQSGFGAAKKDDSDRSRWLQSLGIRETAAGQEKRSIPLFFRLDGFEVHESGSDPSNPEGLFYDLKVNRHPSFSINGALVHNSHRIKSPKAKITNTLHSMRDKFQHHILLSGTAIKNKKEELHTQLDFIKPGFMRRDELKYGTIGGVWHRLRELYIARQKRNVLKDLPEKITQIVEVEVKGMPPIPGDIGEMSKAKVTGALAKVDSTTDFVKEILNSSDSNVLLFTESRFAAEKLKNKLGDVAILHHGQLSDDVRENAKAEFQSKSSSKRVFVSTRQSLAVGATLTRADKVVFNDLPWTAADLRQAEDRVHRIGQENNVNVYWMTAKDDAWDINMAGIVKKKYELNRKMNEGKQLTKEEMEWMNKPVQLDEIKRQIQGEKVGPKK